MDPTPAASQNDPATTLLLIGGGGHAVVVAEAAQLAGVTLRGFLDDYAAAPLGAVLLEPAARDLRDPTASAGPATAKLPASSGSLGPRQGQPAPLAYAVPKHLGTLERLQLTTSSPYILALGNLQVRRRMLEELAKLKLAISAGGGAGVAGAVGSSGGIGGVGTSAGGMHVAATVIHPTAFVSPTARLGPGVFVGPNAIIHSRARIGAHAIINSGAIVEHDCTVGENTHLAPGAVLGGAVTVGSDTLLGLGCRVLPGVAIGNHCTIGAGAVVLVAVGERQTIIGVHRR